MHISFVLVSEANDPPSSVLYQFFESPMPYAPCSLHHQRSSMFEDFLPLVEKPARYINNEINAVHKDLSKVRTRVCLLFPDTYEGGMSHLGLRILYDILNGREDTACERVFSPWT